MGNKMAVPQKELLHDSAIPLLCMYPKNWKQEPKHIFRAMYIAFTVAKKWKQPKYPSSNEWIKQMLYIYTIKYDLAWKEMEFWYMLQHGQTWETLCNLKLARTLKTLYYSTYIKCIAIAKSLQSCPTLCDPIDGSPPSSPVPGILQARTLEWVAISLSNAWKWKAKVKSLSCIQLPAALWTAAYQAPPSMGFSRQEHWSGVPLPSLIA